MDKKSQKQKTFLVVIGALICLFNAFDAIFTHHFLVGGIAEESNPLMLYVLENGGFISFYVIKLLLGSMFLIGAIKAYEHVWVSLAFVGVLGIYIFINVKYHLFGIYLLYFS